PVPDRDEAGPSGRPQGCRLVRRRPLGGSAGRRGQRLHARVRLRVRADEEASLQPLACPEPRGLPTLLRPAPARGGNRPVAPEQDHRRGHRLAVLERAEEGAEGVIRRRAFLRGVSAAGTATMLGLRVWRAGAEPPPETTKLRLIKTANMCWAPQYVAEEFL